MKHLPSQRGFTLVELMIAVTIGLFLVGGLVTLVQAMKRATLSQSGLSQLQENERMAMTLMTDVIQSTGYFTNPLLNTATSSFPVTGAFTAAGQALVGTGTYAAGGNTITVRYMTSGTDNVINCTGNTSSVGAASFINKFSIDAASGNLVCQLIVNGGAPTTVPLINGLTNMQIYYGVQTNTSVSNNSVDAYLDSTAVTNWSTVKSVKLKLTFVNPLNTPATVTFTRIIPVMSNTGVST
jgi:type IV pilus assembly protein PilW